MAAVTPTAHHYQAAQRWLRRDLESIREQRGLTIHSVASAIGIGLRTMQRIENGPNRISKGNLAKLCDHYDVDEETRADLTVLRNLARRRAWWDEHGDVMSPVYAEHCELEQQATGIDISHVMVPGVFQTPGYAEHVQRLGHGASTGVNAGRMVLIRKQRADTFLGRPKVPIRLILDQATTFAPVFEDVIDEQLRFLTELQRDGYLRFKFLPPRKDILPLYALHLLHVGHRTVSCHGGYVYETHNEDPELTQQHRDYFEHLWSLSKAPPNPRKKR